MAGVQREEGPDLRQISDPKKKATVCERHDMPNISHSIAKKIVL